MVADFQQDAIFIHTLSVMKQKKKKNDQKNTLEDGLVVVKHFCSVKFMFCGTRIHVLTTYVFIILYDNCSVRRKSVL